MYKECTNVLQKNLGKKRFEISDNGADDILSIYRAYRPCSRDIVYEKTGQTEHIPVAKLMDYDDFLYTIVQVHRPLRLWFENITGKYQALLYDEDFQPDDKKNLILGEVAALDDIDHRRSDHDFFLFLKEKKVKINKERRTLLRNVFGKVSEDAPIVYENPLKDKGKQMVDTNLDDKEKIPMKQDIDAYFQREVLPFAPDAWMEREKDKVGCEFPFTRLFYKYRPLRSSDEILSELMSLDKELETEFSKLKEEA